VNRILRTIYGPTKETLQEVEAMVRCFIIRMPNRQEVLLR
jgi:hypothetical protein